MIIINKSHYILLYLFIVIFFTKTGQAQLANSPWPMIGHDLRHTSQSQYTGPQKPKVGWKFQTGWSSYSGPAPVIDSDGIVYIGVSSAVNYREGILYAVNPNGTIKWSYPITGGIQSSSAIDLDGSIYIATLGVYSLYAINADGTLKWRTHKPDYISSSPAIGLDGTIFVGSWDNHLYAINRNGTIKWKFQTGDDVRSSPAISEDGTIYVGSLDNHLYAINPDGSLKWKFNKNQGMDFSVVIGSDGTIYWGGYAFYPNGTLKWHTGILASAISADGTIYSYLYAYNSDGTLKWKFDYSQIEGRLIRPPAISADGTVYIGSKDKHIYAVNSDGKLKWKFQIDEEIGSSLVIGADGSLYVLGSEGNLYAIYEAAVPIISPSNPTTTLNII